MTLELHPPTPCILEISDNGVKMVDKTKPPKMSPVSFYSVSSNGQSCCSGSCVSFLFLAVDWLKRTSQLPFMNHAHTVNQSS